MTSQEFCQLEDADVMFCGTLYHLPKNAGDETSPLCTREQFRTGSEPFAHVFNDGIIRRYRKPIGSLDALTVVHNRRPVDPDLPSALAKVVAAKETWPGYRGGDDPA